MLVAVTGSNGFVGRELVQTLLVRGHRVRVLSRRGTDIPGCEVYCADLGASAVGALIPFVEGADALIHCAGETRNEANMERTHVLGTSDLLDAAAGRGIRWIHLSSVGAYGSAHTGEINEDCPERPVGLYEVTKSRSDKLVVEADKADLVEAAILRPSIIIAADMPNSSIRQMAALIRRRLFVHLGKPGASANYVHLDDVVGALIFLLEAKVPPRGVFNLSSWSTMEEFVTAIAKSQGGKIPKTRIPEKIARFLGWAGSRIPGSPLTLSRVDALTRRTSYPSRKIKALGYRMKWSAAQAAADIVQKW